MLSGWQQIGYGSALVGLSVVVCVLWENLRVCRLERDRERRGREEMEAYTRLDARIGRDGDVRAWGRRICNVVAARSPFQRVAMLARNADGRLYVMAREEMGDATVALVEAWALRAVSRERGGAMGRSGGVCMGARSPAVRLNESGRILVVPLWTTDGWMVGALVVQADSLMQVRRRAAEDAVVSLEALAVKLSRAWENAGLAAGLPRAE